MPLETLEIIVSLIGNTKTDQGLEVHAGIDKNHYEKGLKINDDQLAEIHIKRKVFHGEWNYEIHPRGDL